MAARTTTGIRARHSRSCRSASGGACNCRPTWEAWVYLKREGRKATKTFPTQAAAKAWRADATAARNRGALRGPNPTTVREAAEEFMAGAEAKTIFNRRRGPYKPAVIRSYCKVLNSHVLPALGDMKLSDVERDDVEALVERLRGQGKAASTIANVLDPLRCIFRRAIRQGIVAVDPCKGLELERAARRKPRIPDVAETRELLAALPEDKRALWATAAYAGLRHGELRALRVSDIDLDARRIRVERGWDDVEGAQAPKTEAGQRTVVVLAELAPILRAHLLRTGRRGDDLVFGETAEEPFRSATERRRAQAAWKAENARRGEGERPLSAIGFHELRHAFASLLIASGANPKNIQLQMGHATITETFDTYGHLLPGGEEDLLAKADAFMAREGERPALAVVR